MPRVETIVPSPDANAKADLSDLYGGTVLRLPASKLASRTNARPGDAPADEPKRIETLAASMRATGQIMPLVVDRGNGDEWFVVAGARRLAAARTIDEHYMLDCIVRRDGTDALQVAIHENTRRRGYNALQYAHLIAAVRAEKGFTGTKEIAAYMGCSRAQVQQHERLLAKPEGMNDAAYKLLLADLTGKNLRADAAFYALAHVEPARTGEVLERAAEIAREEATEKCPVCGSKSVGGICQNYGCESPRVKPRSKKSATTHAEPSPTPPARQESRQSASESKAEPAKTGPKPIPVAKSLYEALEASYSADKIPSGKIAKPVKTDGHGLLVCVSWSARECKCYRVLSPLDYGKPAVSYNMKGAGDGFKAARNDPNGFYHGMAVSVGSVPYVLFGPPLIFEPFATTAPPAAPVVQKRHVERAAKERAAVKKNAPKARGRAAAATAPWGNATIVRTLPELRKLFDTLRGTSYPDPMRAFISKVNCWWSGDCTDKEVTQQWSQIAMLVEDGLKHTKPGSAGAPVKPAPRKRRQSQ